ncbi:MAG: TonB-dependent receptor [Alphaproteobacteria bacterium]|nr:MAG: TonB-dependent receptor [Alphaproteobacteria bacterium]
MNILYFISTLALQPAEAPIVVTASREPLAQDQAAASTTVLDEEALDDLSLPAVPDLLRLTPGLAVASTGPRGTQTQVRIRGAEANHTLVFLDGIRFNDPAAGNEARFELLTSDSLSRIEIVRGPQSALWGSEALGGVVAAESVDAFAAAGFEGTAEYGSLDSSRLAGRYALTAGDIGVMASAGWLRSDGIDSFGSGGERDGFDNLSASLKVEARPSSSIRLGLVGHYIAGDSEYDGFDPLFFTRADTLDETKNRIAAVRGWALGEWGGWSAEGQASYLDSANRNLLAGAAINSTFGDRLTLGAQLSRRIGGHRLTAAIEHEDEGFRGRDTGYFGGTDQARSRRLTAFAGEWRAQWADWIVTDLAARHDAFSAFADATTFRASVLVRPMEGFGFHAAYGEGIAQPTFYDLYGFFPGSFAGNPGLQPERSRGWEAGMSWSDAHFSLGATYFSARLHDEIVDVFDPATFSSSTANADGVSRREGVELSAGYRHAGWLNLTANYAWLDADEQRVAGTMLVREVRRPRSSANLSGYGTVGRFRWGASLAYVGARTDSDFDLFPAATVRLHDYALASMNIAYRLMGGVEAYARAENAFDADYQDVVGYNTAGRTVYAGLRVAFGD